MLPHRVIYIQRWGMVRLSLYRTVTATDVQHTRDNSRQ